VNLITNCSTCFVGRLAPVPSLRPLPVLSAVRPALGASSLPSRAAPSRASLLSARESAGMWPSHTTPNVASGASSGTVARRLPISSKPWPWSWSPPWPKVPRSRYVDLVSYIVWCVGIGANIYGRRSRIFGGWPVASLRSTSASWPQATPTCWLLPVVPLPRLWTRLPWAPLLVRRWRRCCVSMAPAALRPMCAGVLGCVFSGVLLALRG
jgi:hypothetical protein